MKLDILSVYCVVIVIAEVDVSGGGFFFFVDIFLLLLFCMWECWVFFDFTVLGACFECIWCGILNGKREKAKKKKKKGSQTISAKNTHFQFTSTAARQLDRSINGFMKIIEQISG